ncbi:MAG: hypothetical protein ACHQYP_02505 [Nitrospiria bacterium]
MASVAVIVCIFAGQGFGESPGDEKNLKQLCEDDAKDLYKKETGKIKLEKIDLSYTTHYNKSLKNCFMVIKITTDLNLIEPPTVENLSYDFYDVNVSTKIGSFLIQLDRKSGLETLLFCHVSKVECHSLLEWNKLIKPFMEE